VPPPAGGPSAEIVGLYLGLLERLAPRLWPEASLDQRQRFQSFLFPKGIQVADGVLRTPVTASFYEELHSFTGPEERMVEAVGVEPTSEKRVSRASTCVSF
jgi:hypothetical protein